MRALVEGVGFAFADCLERMRGLGVEPRGLTLTGGGARGELWRGVLAAQLRVPLATAAAAEGPALGAAILAQVGTGVAADLAAAVSAATPRPEPPAPPEAGLVELYLTAHERFRKLYPALRAAGAFKPDGGPGPGA